LGMDESLRSHHIAQNARHGANTKAALQILGSGGPLNGGGRASTSYLIWLKGVPSILVDMGEGAAANFARTGASPSDIDLVLISHLHPDHVSDLPGFLWGAQVLDRNRALKLIGPTGNDFFPSTRIFLKRLFGTKGVFPVMQDLLNPESEFHLDIKTVDAQTVQSSTLLQLNTIIVSAYPVSHGKAPTLAYRIDGPDFSIVFAGDQDGLDSGFAAFAKNCDILILHTAMSPLASDRPFAKVIGVPRILGELAQAASARRVFLSHLMAFPSGNASAADFSLSNSEALLRTIREVYRGELSIASDLEYIAIGHNDNKME
jgi:ribonuclease BN (tRNA processing enzyme)